jgi:hypothetical protein
VRFRRKRNDEEIAASETAVAAPPDPEDVAAVAEPPPPAAEPPPAGESPFSAHRDANSTGEHPEILVGAAFVGGFALAQIVKRFGR